MVRRCWVNFQCRGVLLIWIIVGQGPIVLAIGAGGGCLDIFSLNYLFSFLSPSLWETARYRLKYCLKGPFNPEQPTNQSLTLATVCRADNLYRTGKSFIGPAGWIKSVMARLYQICRLLFIQSKVPYLYDKYGLLSGGSC